MKLSKHVVEKPWGRTDVPPVFGGYDGRRIGEIWYEHKDRQLPILVKWLFTSEKLSIQVHPNDDQARQRGLVSGKEECWFVVSAELGAVLGIGTRSELTDDALRAASISGEIESLMDWKPVAAGDYFYVPAGTVHAIGAGIALVEVQQFADVTYRLYDYGRPRALHLDDGVAVSVASPYQDMRSGKAKGGQQLVDGPFFKLWFIDNAEQLMALQSDQPAWVVPLAGHVQSGDEHAETGDCMFLDSLNALTMSNDAQMLLAVECKN